MTYFPLEKSLYIHFWRGGALMWITGAGSAQYCAYGAAVAAWVQGTRENIEWIIINMGMLSMTMQKAFDKEALTELDIAWDLHCEVKWNNHNFNNLSQ